MMSLAVIALFIVTLLMGVPVAVAMGFAAAVVIGWLDMPLAVVAQRSVNALDSVPLLAVPMFIFAAALFGASGITRHLFLLIRLVVGHVRGALGHVTVLANLVFSGISGAALADIGALGGTQISQMRKQGYRDEFASGITMAAATIGPIFPPSIPLIIYAAAAEVSAVKVLLAGALPALVIAAMLMLRVAYIARRENLPRAAREPGDPPLFRALLTALPALLAPVILIGGLVSGLFGPTEVAAITVLYALILGLFVYRELNWEAIVKAARETVHSTASVLFIVASAALLAWVLTIDQIPTKASSFLLGLSRSPEVLLLIVNVILLVVGMFMESIAAILILAPIFAPALAAAGVDPVHLAVVVVLNLMIGLLTPPVGMSLYMVAQVADMPLQRVVAGALPFLWPLVAALVILTFVPVLSTWLPNLIVN